MKRVEIRRYHKNYTKVIRTLGPIKHENEAIFQRKMSGIRMFLGFQERETRRNP